MQKLVSVLEKTIELLEKSEDSMWTETTVSEAKEILETQLNYLKTTGNFEFSDKSKIKFLFLPTGALQEISITNGWSSEYLKFAQVIDRYTK
jgi:hypothetical protein